MEALAAAALLDNNSAPTSADPPPDARQQPADVTDNFMPFTAPQIQKADSLLRSLQALSHAEQQLGGAPCHGTSTSRSHLLFCCSGGDRGLSGWQGGFVIWR